MPGFELLELGGGIPSLVALSTTSLVVARDAPSRKKIIFCNAGINDIWLARGQYAILNAGIYLQANGGILVDEPDSFGRIYTGTWAALSSSGTSTLSISEDR